MTFSRPRPIVASLVLPLVVLAAAPPLVGELLDRPADPRPVQIDRLAHLHKSSIVDTAGRLSRAPASVAAVHGRPPSIG